MVAALALLLAFQDGSVQATPPQIPQLEGAETAEVRIPGTANPWLAGLGPSAVGGVLNGEIDQAPAHSPISVPLKSIERRFFRFVQAAGTIRLHAGADAPNITPEGDLQADVVRKHSLLNGISDILCPAGGLVGVFLSDDIPTRSLRTPATLNFKADSSRAVTTLSPQLRQVFYIGNGLTPTGVPQVFHAPSNAKRLFLGVMDDRLWRDNNGLFTVTVVSAPR